MINLVELNVVFLEQILIYIYINADVNGSLNILRKYRKECIPELVKQARDNGVVFPPSRLRVA